jgi:hypothetical protein
LWSVAARLAGWHRHRRMTRPTHKTVDLTHATRHHPPRLPRAFPLDLPGQPNRSPGFFLLRLHISVLQMCGAVVALTG